MVTYVGWGRRMNLQGQGDLSNVLAPQITCTNRWNIFSKSYKSWVPDCGLSVWFLLQKSAQTFFYCSTNLIPLNSDTRLLFQYAILRDSAQLMRHQLNWKKIIYSYSIITMIRNQPVTRVISISVVFSDGTYFFCNSQQKQLVCKEK